MHEVYPVAWVTLYESIGRNREELRRRKERSDKCLAFLEVLVSKEAAACTQAEALMDTLMRTYRSLIEQNHRCFENLVELLREEISLLTTAVNPTFSDIPQAFMDQCETLSTGTENELISIPEIAAIQALLSKCQDSLQRASRVRQEEYERRVLDVLQGRKGPRQMEPQQSLPVPHHLEILEKPRSDPVASQATETLTVLAKPLVVLPQLVYSYDAPTNQWLRYIELPKQISVDSTSSYTLIANGNVFVCGGGDNTETACICYIGNAVYVLEQESQTARQQPNMLIGRKVPGIVFIQSRSAVYVFGGLAQSTCYLDYLQTCEKFMLSTSTWCMLPEMQKPRCYFNPCVCSGLVYLCGGLNAPSVETYDLQLNKFTLVPEFTLPESKSCTAVLQSDRLIVISVKYYSIWSLSEHRIVLQQQHQVYGPWSNCTPVVNNGLIYLVDLSTKMFRSVNVANGAVATANKLGA